MPESYTQNYTPANRDDCIRFIVECCTIPSIDAYTGFPETQQQLADELADSFYFEGIPNIVPALQRVLETEAIEENDFVTRRRAELTVHAPDATKPVVTKYVVNVSDVVTGKQLEARASTIDPSPISA